MVYVTTLLYALMVLPLRIIARVDIGERSTVKLRLQALFFTLQFDGVVERGERGLFFSIRPRGRDGREGAPLSLPARSVVRPALQNRRARRYIARHVRVRRLEADVRLGCMQAADTARLCGALMAALSALSGALRRRLHVAPRLRVEPDFARPALLASVRCIIVVLPGDIMATAALGLLHGLRRSARRAIPAKLR